MKAWKIGLAALGAAVTAAAPAGAQLFLNEPKYPAGPIEPNDPLVGLALPDASQAEYRAHLLWNLRSGLNVAALQCQFSPYLRAVNNYNAILDHHSGELATAYEALTGYFKRTYGAKEGPRKFDDYSTQTYNNFSTFHAQFGFCQTAGDIAKEALTLRKGEFHRLATDRMRALRGSLNPAYDGIALYNPQLVRVASLDFLARPDCSLIRKKRDRRRCEEEN